MNARASDPDDAVDDLAALAATRAELAALPEPEVPPAVAARWEAALAAERDRARPAADELLPTPRRRRLRPRVVLAVSAVAAAVVAAVVLGAPRPAPPVITVSGVDLVTIATSAVGVVDVGDLGDPARRRLPARRPPDAARERLSVAAGGLDGRPGAARTRHGARPVARRHRRPGLRTARRNPARPGHGGLTGPE
jgi:hypothetical protein